MPEAAEQYEAIKAAAVAARDNRHRSGKKKGSEREGLFKQGHECVALLATDPRHPWLQTHEFASMKHPFDRKAKAVGAYARSRTSGA